jgi:23S rRNA-/tRNA-specific pseudouridylate synthase
LFIGPPGTGKTHQIRIACQLLQMTVFDTLVHQIFQP